MRRFLASLLLFLALLSIGPALAAIGTPASLGQAGINSTATSVVLTTGANIVSGDAVFIMTAGAATNSFPTTATDSGGVNTYTCRTLNASGPGIAVCFTLNATALASGQTITTSGWNSASNMKSVCAIRVSGMLTASPPWIPSKNVGATSSNGTGTSAAAAVKLGPLPAQPALLLGLLANNSGSTFGTITQAGWTAGCTMTTDPIGVMWWKTLSAYPQDATWQPSWVNSVIYQSRGMYFPGAGAVYAPFGAGTLLGVGQ